jgi:L-fucose isomerase-like protein
MKEPCGELKDILKIKVKIMYEIIKSVEHMIKENNEVEVFSKEVIEKFKETVETLKKADTMVRLVVFINNMDCSEEEFLKRWKTHIG